MPHALTLDIRQNLAARMPLVDYPNPCRDASLMWRPALTEQRYPAPLEP